MLSRRWALRAALHRLRNRIRSGVMSVGLATSRHLPRHVGSGQSARRSRRRKVGLVGSSGGHLAQLLSLQPWWSRYDHFWVTFRKPDAVSLLQRESVYWCHFPTNRSVVNLLRNSVLATRILIRERPTILVSTGAAVAVPFFYLGKVLGAHTVYVEVVDRIDSRTLTGRLVYPVCDLFLVQWPEQLRLYPRATYLGRLL
jgi:UDP-N-acetylglucosamine:LPS N-acetylglucosamine transferase